MQNADGDSKTAEASQPAAPSRPKIWTHGTLTYTATGLWLLLFWLLWGDVAWALRERSVPSVMQLLFKKYGASNLLVGLLISSLPNILVLICGPIVSYHSDRHRGRWGRRMPFLLWHIPIAVLAMIGVAFSPQLGGKLNALLGSFAPGGASSTLIFIAIGWSLFELATVVANAVFYGLVNDVVPTPLLGRFYGLFRGISLIASILFNLYVFGYAEKHFQAIFIGIGAVYGICFISMCLRVKEGQYPPPEPIKEGEGGFIKGVRHYFRKCFSKSYYRWVLAAIALPWISFIGVNHFSVLFARSLSMDMAAYGKCLAVTYTFSLILSYPLGMLADRFHPLRTSLAALSLYVLTTLGGAFFSTSPKAFAVFFVLHGVVSGMWMTSAASLPLRMFPRSNFSQFYSALYMVIGLGIMMAGPLIGQTIDFTHDFYRLTFMASCGFATLGLTVGLVVHAKFMKLGGPRGYVAPE